MEKIIELVRSEPCLYDPGHPDYSKKTYKEMLWAKIARETNFNDGPAAKKAWHKLRNCHRDAIRRKLKIYKSGAPASTWKPWKFEQQMEFLLKHMSNRETSGNMSDINGEEYTMQPVEFSPMNESGEDENNIITMYAESPPDASFVIIESQTNEDTICQESNQDNPAPKKFKHDINTLIAQTLKNHEERAQGRAAARENDGDDLFQFFKAMYVTTKKMPPLTQSRIKRKIFNIVSEEEELLFNYESRESTEIQTPMPSQD